MEHQQVHQLQKTGLKEDENKILFYLIVLWRHLKCFNVGQNISLYVFQSSDALTC